MRCDQQQHCHWAGLMFLCLHLIVSLTPYIIINIIRHGLRFIMHGWVAVDEV